MLTADEESDLRWSSAGETAADDVSYHVMIRQLAISNSGIRCINIGLLPTRLSNNSTNIAILLTSRNPPNKKTVDACQLSSPRDGVHWAV